MITSKINATESTEALITQINAIINEIAYELNLGTAKLTDSDKRIANLNDKWKQLAVEFKESKKGTGDIFRSQSARTLKLGTAEDADATTASIYMDASGKLKYKDRANVAQTVSTGGGIVSSSTVDAFFQNNPAGTEFGLQTHKFMINTASGKLALYELLGGNWVHKVDFGSVITDRFVFTKPMGGLQFRHKDGFDYDAVRASPTGNGKGIAVGNYAGPLFLVSDLSGVMMVKEKGPDYYKVDPFVNVTANVVKSKTFSFPVKVGGPRVVYGGTVKVKPSPVARKLICRHWIEAFDGTVLHETLTKSNWDASGNPEELHRSVDAEYVEIPANATEAPFLASKPIGITDYKTAFDIKLCWEFKEDLEVLGTSSGAINYSLEYEEGLIEKVASQEWVTAQLATLPSVDTSNLAKLNDVNEFTNTQFLRSGVVGDPDTSIFMYTAKGDKSGRTMLQTDGSMLFSDGSTTGWTTKARLSRVASGKLGINDVAIATVNDLAGKANITTTNRFSEEQVFDGGVLSNGLNTNYGQPGMYLETWGSITDGSNFMKIGIKADGKLGFGDGITAIDTWLSRDGAGNLKVGSNRLLTSADVPPSVNPFRNTWIVEDFYTYNTTGSRVFVSAGLLSGTLATASTMLSDADHPGIVRVSSSTSANSGGLIATTANTILLSNGCKFRSVARFPSVSTVTTRIGYIDTNSIVDCADGIYFEIIDGVATFKTASSSSRTSSSSSYTCATNTWYEFRIELSNSLARGYILSDTGAVLFTSNTIGATLPMSSGKQTGCGVIATSSGTTSVEILQVDYLAMKTSPSTASYRQAWD